MRARNRYGDVVVSQDPIGAADLAWAERKLLAHVAFDDQRWRSVADRLASDDFLDPRGARVWSAISAQAEDGEPRDVVSVLHRLRAEDGTEVHTDMREYLGELLDHASPVYAEPAVIGWARMIREEARRRHTRRTALDLAAAASDMTESPQAVIQAAHDALARISVQAWEDDADEDATLHATADRLLRLYDTGEDPGQLHTGFASLDRLLTNLRPGTLTVLAGTTSYGKTALSLQIADHVAKDRPATFVSLEMPAEEVQARRLYRTARIPEAVFRQWIASPVRSVHDEVRFAEATLRTAKLDLHEGSFTAAEIRALARRRKVRSGLDLLVVDYLGLITPSEKHDSREQEVNASTRSLKACAIELQTAVIAVAQLNREADADRKVGYHTPELRHLRDSGSIEQHADNVLMLSRDPKDDQHVATLTLRKQRNGRLGSCKLRFIGEVFTFTETGVSQSDE